MLKIAGDSQRGTVDYNLVINFYAVFLAIKLIGTGPEKALAFYSLGQEIDSFSRDVQIFQDVIFQITTRCNYKIKVLWKPEEPGSNQCLLETVSVKGEIQIVDIQNNGAFENPLQQHGRYAGIWHGLQGEYIFRFKQ